MFLPMDWSVIEQRHPELVKPALKRARQMGLLDPQTPPQQADWGYEWAERRKGRGHGDLFKKLQQGELSEAEREELLEAYVQKRCKSAYVYLTAAPPEEDEPGGAGLFHDPLEVREVPGELRQYFRRQGRQIDTVPERSR